MSYSDSNANESFEKVAELGTIENAEKIAVLCGVHQKMFY
jgi:hypothetical protein